MQRMKMLNGCSYQEVSVSGPHGMSESKEVMWLSSSSPSRTSASPFPVDPLGGYVYSLRCAFDEWSIPSIFVELY